MSERFTAAVVKEFGSTLTIREEDLPEPGRFQALVKNVASGICHTEAHAAGGRLARQAPHYPSFPATKVSAKCSSWAPVSTTSRSVTWWATRGCGKRAAPANSAAPAAKPTVPTRSTADTPSTAPSASTCPVDTRYCARIPEGSDPIEVAPILCAGVTVYKGLKEANTRPGEYMVIFGAGLLRPRQDSPGGQGSAAGGRQ